MPYQDLKQDEFECLNLNITCPSDFNQFSRLPVMLWVHGYATSSHHSFPVLIPPIAVGIEVPARIGFTMAGH
jgi:hypothetical protein